MDMQQWQIDMARRTPPPVDAFVDGSTPVVSFGDPLVAEVATIGINPSRQEFRDVGGAWLRGSKQRLATLESLGAVQGQELTHEQARQVVEWCNDYFDRNPYWKWFKPLDKLLVAAVGAGYRGSAACHLDLVQWATDPVWGGLSQAADKKVLLDEGRPHLIKLLSGSNVRLVLANGKAVIDQLKKIGLAQWEVVGTLPLGKTTCTLAGAESNGVRFVGWSTNLQGAFGVSTEFKAQLAEAVRKLLGPSAPLLPVVDPDPTRVGSLELDARGHLQPNLKVRGKGELNALLSQWFNQSGAPTLGDVGNFGGRPAVIVDLGDHTVVLNVDTKRAAIGAYLAQVESSDVDQPWRVVANARGRFNKVIFSEEPALAAGWYMYLSRPSDGVASL